MTQKIIANRNKIVCSFVLFEMKRRIERKYWPIIDQWTEKLRCESTCERSQLIGLATRMMQLARMCRTFIYQQCLHLNLASHFVMCYQMTDPLYLHGILI